MNWDKVVFLHTGWASRYDGTEAPEGGHAYLKKAIGVEAENFKETGGWCYGYAPVSRTGEGRQLDHIPEAYRTLKIERLGASSRQTEVDGITVVWTARSPLRGPVIVGIYDDATVYRFMPPMTQETRTFISKAPARACHLVPESRRTFDVVHKKKGFPGMAAAWFPGVHYDGPAQAMLEAVADYLPKVRRYTFDGQEVLAPSR